MRKNFKFQISNLKFKIKNWILEIGYWKLDIPAKRQAGQAILIIVLIMVVGLTVGLALVSRSVTNVRTSTEEENSQRAFSAAEAGIEQALKEECPLDGGICIRNIESDEDIGNFSNFDVTITARSGAEVLLNGGNTVIKDNGMDLWLVPHNADGSLDYTTLWSGNLTLHWGYQGENCVGNMPAAIEMVIIEGPVANPKSYRYAFDKCASNRENFFNSINSGVGSFTLQGIVFGVKTNSPIPITNGIIVRIIPFYENTIIGVAGNIAIPPQGKKIVAVGKSGNTERKIDYFQGYPSLPVEFFPYILFAP